MHATKAEINQYHVGFYSCSRMGKEVELRMDVPRPWVLWPVRTICTVCGELHILEYSDVREPNPAFGHE